jgi:hypothetical protein
MSRPLRERLIRNRLIRTPGIYQLARGVDQTIWRMRIARLRAAGRARTGLSSYPRSGNTWMRHLIEKATGKSTGSIHADDMMRRGREGVVIKTHAHDAYRYTRAVYLIRNPFDALDSHYHSVKEASWNAHRHRDLLFEEFIRTRASGYCDHARYRLAADIDKCKLRYEDLHADTVGELARVLEWLGEPATPEKLAEVIEQSRLERLRKMDKKKGEKFFRQGKVGTGIEHYSDELRRHVIRCTADVLEPMGYGDLLAQYG